MSKGRTQLLLLMDWFGTFYRTILDLFFISILCWNGILFQYKSLSGEERPEAVQNMKYVEHNKVIGM